MSLISRVRSAILGRTGEVGPEGHPVLYTRIWGEAALSVGGELESLGEGFFRVRRRDRSTILREHVVELDHPARIALARTRPLVHRLLAARALPVPASTTIELSNLGPALALLHDVGPPLVVKPAEHAGGDGVTANVATPGQLRRAVAIATLFGRKVIVERQVSGDRYRLLYLDGVLLEALRRRAPTVVGDGRSSVRELVGAENARRLQTRGAAQGKRIAFSLDTLTTLRRSGWTPFSVPPRGEPVPVASATGDAVDRACHSVWTEIGEALTREGALAVRVVGLRLAGLDVVTPDPHLSLGACGGRILEIQPCPELHGHYQTVDPQAQVPVAVPILEKLLDEAAPEV